MVKEPTVPPEGSKKPQPPREPFTALPAHLLTPEGRDKLFEAKGPSVTPTYSPPDDPDSGTLDPADEFEDDGVASGPFWDAPIFEIEEDGTLERPYAIIEDMDSLFRDLYGDLMDTTFKMRSAALKWLCRGIAGVIGTVVLTLLLIGGLGVVLAVALSRFLDRAELAYWVGRDQP